MITYKFNFSKGVAVSCTVKNINTGETKKINTVWPPTAVSRAAYIALGLELPDDLK